MNKQKMDDRQLERAMRLPRHGLLDQGRYHLGLETRFRKELEERGWTPENSAAIGLAILELESERSAAVEARLVNVDNRAEESARLAEGKSLKRQLVKAVSLLQRRGVATDAEFAKLSRSGRIRDGVDLSKYFVDIRPVLLRLEQSLRPYFKGCGVVKLVDDNKEELDKARTVRKIDFNALPLETLKVYEAKAALLSAIEDMNAIGQIAFDGNAAISALFNKDLILAARRRRGAKAEEVEVAAPAQLVPACEPRAAGDEKSAG